MRLSAPTGPSGRTGDLPGSCSRDNDHQAPVDVVLVAAVVMTLPWSPSNSDRKRHR